MADLFTRLAARAHGLDQRYVPRLAPRLPALFEGRELAPDNDSGLDSPEQPVEATRAGHAPKDAPAKPGIQASPVATEPPRPAAVEPPAPRVAPMSTQSPVAAGAEQIRSERDPAHHLLTRPVQHEHEHEHAGDRVSEQEHMEVGGRIRPAQVSGAYGVPVNGFDSTGKQQGKPPELPSVHISIGRIEVRATPAPAKPPAPNEPAAPPQDTGLRLVDYLRGDDGRPK